MLDWKDTVAKMVLVKQELLIQDSDCIWPHHFPEIGASESQLCMLENEFGYVLDQAYRGFLNYSNGWKGFYQTVDLLGTEQLQDSMKMKYVNNVLHAIHEDVLNGSRVSRNQLLPIGVSEFDKDLFVLCLSNAAEPGAVIWFAGEEIERFENFYEFFVTMIDYNREEICNYMKVR